VPQAVIAPLPEKPQVKLGIWQGMHKINYSDDDLINSDPELVKEMTDGTLFPDDGTD